MSTKSVEKSRATALANGHYTYVSERPCKACQADGHSEFLRYVSQGQCVVCAQRNSKVQQKLKAKIKRDAYTLEQEQNEIAVLVLRRARYGLNSQSFQESDRARLHYLQVKHKTKNQTSAAPASEPNPWD